MQSAHAIAVHDIDCIGVWDTVGALGVPLGIFDRLNHTRFAFHDVTLSAHIKNAENIFSRQFKKEERRFD